MANEMKSSNAVMDVVRNYMEERCASDPILAIKYAIRRNHWKRL